jgi:hypothetical protein
MFSMMPLTMNISLLSMHIQNDPLLSILGSGTGILLVHIGCNKRHATTVIIDN